MESNWTHVPHGYKNEAEAVKAMYNRIMKQEALMHGTVNEQKKFEEVDKHSVDHLKMENTVLKSKLTKQKHLIEDLKDLVDMFATRNVDLRFYKRVIKDYLGSIEYSHKD
jgi:predicted nuclease with TOPRIM domain